MPQDFTLSQFLIRFPNDDACLEEVATQKYPDGILCTKCNKITHHYRVQNRASYVCKFCRRQVYPLKGTLFEKSSTPLRIWFLAMFLMIQTKDGLSSKQLQKELGVTYKTAWRIHKNIRILMEQNDGDLLKGTVIMERKEYREHKWAFFNIFEIKMVHKRESSKDDEEL